MSRGFSTRSLNIVGGLLALLLALAIAAYFRVPWMALALFGLLLLGVWGAYRRQMRRHIREWVGATRLKDMPIPASGEALEHWARRYVDATALQLADSREILDSLFDILQDGILLLDAENRILRANAAAIAMLGHHPDGLIGTPLARAANQEALANLASKVRPVPIKLPKSICPPSPDPATSPAFPCAGAKPTAAPGSCSSCAT